jgi:hypothetical protein
MSANDIQVGGEHYRNRPIQPWDFIVSNNMNFLEGSVIKYVVRHKDKNGVEDLLKARHYLDKLIETHQEPVPADTSVIEALVVDAPWGVKKDGTPKSRPGRRPGQRNGRTK